MSPVLDPAARYAQREGIELAFLTSIQRLPGRQRVVLILRDVLGWSAAEIAELLDSSAAAVNSALQRAPRRDRRASAGPTVLPGRARDRDLLRRYVEAWERTDIAGLVALMREDATLTMPPQAAIAGAEAIGAFFAWVLGASDITATATFANGFTGRRPVRARPGRQSHPAPSARARGRGRSHREAARALRRPARRRVPAPRGLTAGRT